MSFRIISGRNKGRRIQAPSSLPVRPTMDFAKEGLFNVLNNYFNFNDILVLDLFAGTGNISYEFASRGAKMVVAVDSNHSCTSFIKETISKIGFSHVSVINKDVIKFLKDHSAKYDIIFADPPFEMENKTEVIELIFSKDLLNPRGWLILEHPGSDDFSSLPNFHELRRYGKVNFSIFVQQ